MDHLEETLQKVRTRYEADEHIVAVLLIGSFARGTAHQRSDIDLSFVVSPSELERRRNAGALHVDASDLRAEGHIGGGVVDVPFMRAVAERGPEPARYAFTAARVLFSRDTEVTRLLPAIPVYRERERLEKMRSFVSQLPVHLSYLVLGDLSDNAWLLGQTATELVFFAGRLILAHNRVLYGNRKQFMRQLTEAAEKPTEMVDLAQELMRTPGTKQQQPRGWASEKAREFSDLVMGFRDWPAAPEGPWARYGRDRETNWIDGSPALADS